MNQRLSPTIASDSGFALLPVRIKAFQQKMKNTIQISLAAALDSPRSVSHHRRGSIVEAIEAEEPRVHACACSVPNHLLNDG